MTEFKTILCPVDLSDPSSSAVPVALAMARTHGARLLLVHVVDDAFPFPDAFAWVSPGEDYHRAMRKAALEGMEKILAAHGEHGVTVERIVLQGRPHREVLALAQERGVDLIVLSTRGRSGLDWALIGSQAEKIIRGAACPVLTIKPKPAP